MPGKALTASCWLRKTCFSTEQLPNFETNVPALEKLFKSIVSVPGINLIQTSQITMAPVVKDPSIVERLAEGIRQALHVQRKRRPTKPTAASATTPTTPRPVTESNPSASANQTGRRPLPASVPGSPRAATSSSGSGPMTRTRQVVTSASTPGGRWPPPAPARRRGPARRGAPAGATAPAGCGSGAIVAGTMPTAPGSG